MSSPLIGEVMKMYRWIITVLLCMMSISMYAVTRIVDITGAGQYTSIQTAVTASSAGDTVLVYPGRYQENINISVGNITIISLEYAFNDPSYIESTIIDGGLNAQGIRINQNVQNINIRGFSITNSRIGISLGQNSISAITNCSLFGNVSSYGGGINLFKSTTVLSGVRIFDNYAYIMAGGIYINGYLGTVSVTFDPVNRCSIYNNTAGAGQDIVAHSINNDLSIPLDMFTVSNPASYYAAAFRASGNEFQLLIDAQTAHHQEINNDLYVSPEGDDANDGLSPATALKTIRTAVYRIASDSTNQKTVHILPGTYSRTANQQVFPIPLKSWVKVEGAGIEETQIVGEMDPAYASVQYNPLKVFASFYQTHANLENMSITSAGSNNSCAIWGFYEESLHLKKLRLHELSPDQNAVINITYAFNTLWDKVILEDIVTDGYGFVSCQGNLSGVIKDCTFRNGVNTFTSSEVWGDALVWVSIGESIVVENSTFTNLSMADDDSQAISFGGIPNPTIQQYYTFRNCLFSNISSNERGVLVVGEAYPVMNITNCTFAGHTGNGEALMVNGNVTISNSIFYNDRSVEIAINPMDGTGIPTTLTLNNNLIRNGYSDIWQGIASTVNYSDSNITGNPFFYGGDDITNPAYYGLSEYSPCINSGTPDTLGLFLPSYDLAGNWRVWDGRIDMGCFEFGSLPYVGIDDPLTPVLQNGLLSAYPNPFTAFTNLKVILPSKLDDSMPRVTTASIDIYNIKGQKVKSISLDPNKTIEQYTYWDGRDAGGKKCSSGIYFLNLSVDGKRCLSKKVTLFR